MLKEASDLYLATDEDREGEAISWHLCEVLQPKVPVHRLVFHEITEEAIREALKHPRQIDEDLVRAQETRRIIDRLFGYEVSPLLWRKIRLAALGRPRAERGGAVDRQARAATDGLHAGHLLGPAGHIRQAGRGVVRGRAGLGRRPADPLQPRLRPGHGPLKDPSLMLLDQRQAEALLERNRRADGRVADVEDRPYTTRPYPPFTTSTLQQEANRKYGFTARQTMQVAQSLYENGHITYMRTDSTNLATVAIARRPGAGRLAVRAGVPAGSSRGIYQTKVKNAQEAHEAIRPAGHPFDLPDALRGRLSAEEFRIYDLVWKRTMASQMADARGHRITIRVDADGALFQVSGKTIEFPGYLRAYVEGSDDPEAELADREVILPAVRVGEPLRVPRAGAQESHHAAAQSLQRSGPDPGAGRDGHRPAEHLRLDHRHDPGPQLRLQVGRGRLVPTWVAFAVCQLLEATCRI